MRTSVAMIAQSVMRRPLSLPTCASWRPMRGICRLFARGAIMAATLILSAATIAGKEAKRPRILGISQVALLSTNSKATGSFLSGILAGGSDSCSWANTSSVLDYYNFSGSCAGQNLRIRNSPQPPPSNLLAEVEFETDDLKSLKEYLSAKGVSLLEKESSDSYLAVQDPDGHRIGFRQFPSTRLPGSGLRIIHAGFIVRDRLKMDHFYKNILGFRLYWQGGMKDETNWISLQVPDGTDWIEFMVNLPPDPDQRLRGIMNHIALGVKDIRETREQLVKNGVHLTEEPKLGRDGKWQLNVYDPDQTRIEFMEFTPKEKPCCSEFTGPHPKP